jgi:acyl-CoA synthetase (AMP-forming)/AMP-acid ligase II
MPISGSAGAAVVVGDGVGSWGIVRSSRRAASAIASSTEANRPLCTAAWIEATRSLGNRTCVVLKPGEVLSANDLMAYCRRSLANYKIPRRVEFLDTELPKSGSGKILKRILRERFWAYHERAVN